VKAKSRIGESLPDQAHVSVTVFNRRVLLTGEVPSDQWKQKAEEVVRGINNVNSIVNELAIQGASSLSSRSNDAYLESRVKGAMVGEKDMRANFYKVVCERDTVYLMGRHARRRCCRRECGGAGPGRCTGGQGIPVHQAGRCSGVVGRGCVGR